MRHIPIPQQMQQLSGSQKGKIRMRKQEALDLIDVHKNKLINPVEMLHWTWLRVIILTTTDKEWEELVGRAMEILAK